MEINLITHNVNKVKEFKAFLEPDLKVNHLDFEYPELRSDDPGEIVSIAAKSLAEKLGKTIVVEDSGFFIEALGGFPGTCTAYIHKRIGVQGVLKVMEKVDNRKCFYKSAIGYCSPGEEPKVFLGSEEGKVALSERGEFGWGQDSIFIPQGSENTYGEIRKEGDVNLFRQRALEKFLEYLKTINSV